MLGESVLIRPYSSSGVVAYIGETEFANGTWIGIELDAPKGKIVFQDMLSTLTSLIAHFICIYNYQQLDIIFVYLSFTGKNDGSVKGVRYFTCKPKHGMFVRADKLILDRRGRAVRMDKADTLSNSNKCALSRGGYKYSIF